jgi:HEPN domain-containing protein
VFVLHGEAFPFVHELKKLLSRLERIGHKVPKYLWKANDLSPYAVETRYPGFSDRVTEREYRRAVQIAERVVLWAERQIERAEKRR